MTAFRMIEQPKNQPYTDNIDSKANLKPRLVECPKCLYEIMTDLPNPKCGDCHRQLITQVEKNLASGVDF